MVSHLNQMQIIGNLGQDPVVNKTKDGKKVANLNVATTESWTDKDGKKQENTTWHKVVIFGKPAETAEKYLTKGSKVFIQGKVQHNEWTDKDNITRPDFQVVVDINGIMTMLDSKPVEAKEEPAETAE